MLPSIRLLILTIATIAAVADAALENSPSNLPSPSTQPQGPQGSLADAPSLRLRVILKRKTMKVHGQYLFDVFARPVISADGASARYDGFATFINGDTQFTYMLVDGAAYMVETSGNGTTEATTQTTRCVPTDVQFESIVSALNNATIIPSASVSDETLKCADGSMLKTSVGGQDFVICASGASGFIASSSDMAVAVEYLDAPIKSISPPVKMEGSVACDGVGAYTSVTPTGLALLAGTGIPSANSRNLQKTMHQATNESTCS
ncbi:hypothetical protein PHYBOEH_007777 [Phytophthora boehmeriae]|uniref:Uncharacterized protein n=1 Tax=Phytophthora boehmeriae TaxID=109152 RepID=A0A8T1W5H1_9STRA|nr:hypothetical protein PHYBOEH_007777 [Phytophthora boehmeriae]